MSNFTKNLVISPEIEAKLQRAKNVSVATKRSVFC